MLPLLTELIYENSVRFGHCLGVNLYQQITNQQITFSSVPLIRNHYLPSAFGPTLLQECLDPFSYEEIGTLTLT
jgi:hypothetical protein